VPVSIQQEVNEAVNRDRTKRSTGSPINPAPGEPDVGRNKKEAVMSVSIVRLGTARTEGEGTRIGTVRRPPRGVPKSQFASQNWYDVWFPNLAPSAETMKLGQEASTPAQWAAFVKKYRAEMATPENSRTLNLLAVLSHQSNFSVGCYCENEAHCHRSVLRALLAERGAKIE
jgi:uncharacterized protein YeaO (DUF488 family)